MSGGGWWVKSQLQWEIFIIIIIGLLPSTMDGVLFISGDLIRPLVTGFN